jgi:hypothetical protein
MSTAYVVTLGCVVLACVISATVLGLNGHAAGVATPLAVLGSAALGALTGRSGRAP